MKLQDTAGGERTRIAEQAAQTVMWGEKMLRHTLTETQMMYIRGRQIEALNTLHALNVLPPPHTVGPEDYIVCEDGS